MVTQSIKYIYLHIMQVNTSHISRPTHDAFFVYFNTTEHNFHIQLKKTLNIQKETGNYEFITSF